MTARTPVLTNPTHSPAGPRMPAEWAPHERTIMGWPVRTHVWGSELTAAMRDYALCARAIARFEPVTMLAPRQHLDAAADLCGPAVEVIEFDIDDSWLRDSGPMYVLAEGRRDIVGWQFNSWGGKFLPYDHDRTVKYRWGQRRGESIVDEDMVLEGGSISVDGEGTLLTTEQCLLHPNRNPSMTRAQIEQRIRTRLGVDTIVWIPFGLNDDDDTDGHVDNVACFVRPGVVMVQGCDDPDEPDHDRLSVNRRCIEGTIDAAGRALEVIELPVLPFVEIGGVRAPVPYLNFYLGNGAVIVPVCGHRRDAEMLSIIADAFPDREVVAVPGATFALGGGGVHCITQQVPAEPTR
ncbi:MAG: agmatine/peptidylarginine deiminase [Acidimicrobiia bacterium]